MCCTYSVGTGCDNRTSRRVSPRQSGYTRGVGQACDKRCVTLVTRDIERMFVEHLFALTLYLRLRVAPPHAHAHEHEHAHEHARESRCVSKPRPVPASGP